MGGLDLEGNPVDQVRRRISRSGGVDRVALRDARLVITVCPVASAEQVEVVVRLIEDEGIGGSVPSACRSGVDA